MSVHRKVTMDTGKFRKRPFRAVSGIWTGGPNARSRLPCSKFIIHKNNFAFALEYYVPTTQVFWGCGMVNGVEADLDVVVVIVYRLAHVFFLTCGVEWNMRGETRLAFLRNELAGIRWMMYRGGSELWLLSFSMATCRVGWIFLFPSFKLVASNHKYNYH